MRRAGWSWHKLYAGHYITSMVMDEELERGGVCFLMLHMTVRRVEDGRWEATFRRSDDALKAPWQCVVSLGTYRTAGEACDVLHREHASRNRVSA